MRKRGLAAVGRRSSRRCQGNGSSAGRGPASLGPARLYSHHTPGSGALGLAVLISAAQLGMGLRSGVRRRPFPGAVRAARV